MVEARPFDILGAFQSVRVRLAAVIYSRVKDRATTADLMQDTFLRIWERKAVVAHVADIAAYFIATGRNIAFDHVRRSRISPFVSGIDHLETVADQAPLPEAVVIHRDELMRLTRVIDAMPPRARAVFILSRMEGLTYVEIGERLGISPKTAFSHMVTALQRLKAGMSDG